MEKQSVKETFWSISIKGVWRQTTPKPHFFEKKGSPIVNGAPRVTMVESETTTENPQTVKWVIPLDERKRPPVDLEKLAKLKWTDGHSHGEIARIMGRSRNTINSALRRVSSGKAAYKRMK